MNKIKSLQEEEIADLSKVPFASNNEQFSNFKNGLATNQEE